MFFITDLETTDLQLFPDFAKDVRVEETTCDCGGLIQFGEQNGLDTRFCSSCGYTVKTQKEYSSAQDNSQHLNNVKTDAAKIISTYFPNLETRKVEKAVNCYMLLHSSEPHRKNRRKGDIAAAVIHATADETGRPIYNRAEVAEKCQIMQKYVSSGLNLTLHVLNTHRPIDITQECMIFITNFLNNISPEIVSFAEPICNIIMTADSVNIGRSVPLRTRSAGALWLWIRGYQSVVHAERDELIMSITDKRFEKIASMQKETFMKFYKEFVLAAHTLRRIDNLYTNEILSRREILQSYMKSIGIVVPPLSKTLKVVTDHRQKYIIDL